MSTPVTLLSVIAAVARNNAIGRKNRLLYRLPNDMKRFKALTTGHTVIMGRRTFESLPQGALPHRRNIVLSRQEDAVFEGAERFGSLSEALSHCRTEEEVFVIGGAEIYRQALPLAGKLYLTFVEDTPADADAYFPPLVSGEWRETKRDARPADEKHLFPYTFVDYERTGSSSPD